MVGGELANCSCRTGVGGYSIPELKRDLLRAEQAGLVASDGKCTLLPDELRDPAFGVHRFCVTRLYDRCTHGADARACKMAACAATSAFVMKWMSPLQNCL